MLGGIGLVALLAADSSCNADGGPSATTSTIVAAPRTVEADGLSVSEVEVTLLDEDRNPVEGVTTRIAATGSGPVIEPGSRVTDDAGTAYFTIASAVTGTWEVIIAAPPDLDGISAEVAFVEPGQTIDYDGSSHARRDCIDDGGVIKAISGDSESGTEVCMFTASVCPSGWNPANDWSTSEESSASWSQPARSESSQTCNGQAAVLPAIAAGTGMLSSGSHPWSNTPPETAECPVFGGVSLGGDCASVEITQVSAISDDPCGGQSAVITQVFQDPAGNVLATFERPVTEVVSVSATITEIGCY